MDRQVAGKSAANRARQARRPRNHPQNKGPAGIHRRPHAFLNAERWTPGYCSGAGTGSTASSFTFITMLVKTAAGSVRYIVNFANRGPRS
jgi:hypothetical protein